MRPCKRISLPLVFSALLLLVPASALAASPAVHPLLKVAQNAKLGTILVTVKGMTLYYYSLDKHGKSACSGECARFWPPLLLPKGAAVPSAPSGASGKCGVVTRPDGARQLTYDGKPLYTFIKDKKPGQTNGQGLAKVWWVAVVSAPSSSSSSGGGW